MIPPWRKRRGSGGGASTFPHRSREGPEAHSEETTNYRSLGDIIEIMYHPRVLLSIILFFGERVGGASFAVLALTSLVTLV